LASEAQRGRASCSVVRAAQASEVQSLLDLLQRVGTADLVEQNWLRSALSAEPTAGAGAS